MWEQLGERLAPEERASEEGMKLTAHRIGNLHPVVVVHMPPPERSLETYFLALVLTPTLRYFTLGRSFSLPGESAEAATATTLREVSVEENAKAKKAVVGVLEVKPAEPRPHLMRTGCLQDEHGAFVDSIQPLPSRIKGQPVHAHRQRSLAPQTALPHVPDLEALAVGTHQLFAPRAEGEVLLTDDGQVVR
jgi:hypothetical protein